MWVRKDLLNLEKKEIYKILKFYKSLYPNSKLSDKDKDTVDAWYSLLEQYEYEEVKDAIIRVSKQRNSYMPTVINIIDNIYVKGYTVEKVGTNTIIVRYEDEQRGNFPFRFSSKEEAAEYAMKFRECDYDYDVIKEIHEIYLRNRNMNPLIVKPMKDKDGNLLVPVVSKTTVQKNKMELRRQMKMLFA